MHARISQATAFICLVAFLPYAVRFGAFLTSADYWLNALETVPFAVVGLAAAWLAWREAPSWPVVVIAAAASALAMQSADVWRLSLAHLHQSAASPVADVFAFKWMETKALARSGLVLNMMSTFTRYFLSPLLEVVLIALAAMALARSRRVGPMAESLR